MYNISNKSNKKLIKKHKRLRILKFISIYIGQFIKQTNLQGLIYVGNPRLSLWERLYFLVWFIAVITIAINFATNVYQRWETTPVIIASESRSTSIQTTPFPATTVCNMNQALRSKTDHFSNHSLEYARTQKICWQDMDYSQFDDLKSSSEDDTFSNFIWRNGQSCDNMIVYCRYGGKEDRCTDFFREVLMDEGICCTFNTLHPSYLYKGEYIFIRDFTSSIGTIAVDWNLETGYAKNLPLYYYPRTPLGAGLTLGFSFVLNANVSEYKCSSTYGTGFKVITHNPIDTPQVKETGLSVQPGYQHRFLVDRFHISKALPSLRSITPKRRQCLFNNELELQYFRYYTRRNCVMECDSEFFLLRCQCIPYYMPRTNRTAKICDVADFNCEIAADAEVHDKYRLACKSDCLPGCFNLEYFPKVFRTPLLNASLGFKDKFFANLSRQQIQQNLALVEIYFTDDQFRAYVRSPYTSFTDYLSQTGGIMSLMVGFGVMSIPEFFYFFLIRPVVDLLLRRIPCAVRKVNTKRFRKVFDGCRTLLTEKQTFYPHSRKPLATCRRPLKSFTGYTSPHMPNLNGFIKASLQKSNHLNIDTEVEGLFPYTE